jgi:hypothetical protein
VAYHLTGRAAYKAAAAYKLTPVKGGLEFVTKDHILIEDACGRGIALPEGTKYTITGTKNGDGYVMTFDANDKLGGTRYLDARVGCKLVY